MRADTSAPVLLKFHSAINMSAKVNMRDKLTSHIHITLRMYNESGILNDGDINEFPVLYIEIHIFFIESNHIFIRERKKNGRLNSYLLNASGCLNNI